MVGGPQEHPSPGGACDEGVSDPKFTARVVAETRALLAKVPK